MYVAMFSLKVETLLLLYHTYVVQYVFVNVT